MAVRIYSTNIYLAPLHSKQYSRSHRQNSRQNEQKFQISWCLQCGIMRRKWSFLTLNFLRLSLGGPSKTSSLSPPSPSISITTTGRYGSADTQDPKDTLHFSMVLNPILHFPTSVPLLWASPVPRRTFNLQVLSRPYLQAILFILIQMHIFFSFNLIIQWIKTIAPCRICLGLWLFLYIHMPLLSQNPS